MTIIDKEVHLGIEVRGTHSQSTLLEFSRLLYHLDLSYEIARLATDARYREFEFPVHTFRRVISPLSYGDRLILDRVSQQSPWAIHVSLQDAFAAVTGGLGAVWLLLQCLEKISMYGLNREKLRLEIEKARLELEERRQLRFPSAPTVVKRIASQDEKAKVEKPHVRTKVPSIPVEEQSSILPPREAVKLLRRLRSRGAASLFESNSRILGNLGYRVLDVEVKIEGEAE